MDDPPARGELGYGDWCRRLIEAGHCACEGCGGHLDGRVCRSCGCTYHVSEPTRWVKASYATWIPNYEGGCATADAHLAEAAEKR